MRRYLQNITNLSKKIRGGALSYVILMILILSIMLSMYLLYRYYKVKEVDIEYISLRLQQNIESGINLLEHNVVDISNSNAEIALFQEAVDSLRFNKREWGVFDLINIRATLKGKQRQRLMFCGVDYKAEGFPALYLADKNRYLSVSGKSGIIGNCVLPRMGVRRGYAEGVGFYADSLVYGTVGESEKILPKLNDRFTTIGDNSYQQSDTLVDYSSLPFGKIFFNSFNSTRVSIAGKKMFRPSGVRLKGNIVLCADSLIVIDKSMMLTDVIVSAQEIHIKSGFKGRVQLFATKRIVIDGGVTLMYPSAIVLSSKHKPEKLKPMVTIGGRSAVYGVVSVTDTDKKSKEIIYKADPGSFVSGVVYVDGVACQQGTIHGSIYTEMFRYRSRIAEYENHLSGIVINNRIVKKGFAVPDMFNSKTNIKCMFRVE